MSDPGERSAELEDLIEQLETEKEELQRIREETERLHHRFAGLYENAPVGYVILNPRGIVIQANVTAREFLGAESVLANRSALGPVFSRESQREYYAALRRAERDKECVTAVVRIDRHETPDLWLQLQVAAEVDEAGVVLEYRVTVENVSERVEAQQEAEKLLEQKEVLLREIHHRVKNDFHLVSSFLSLQSGGTDNPEVRDALDDARRRVASMEEVYRTLHDQSRYSRADLAPLLRGVSEAFRPEVEDAGATLTLYLESVEVSTKTSVSTGILLNELLTNATKYAARDSGAEAATAVSSATGAPEITVTLARTAPDTFELSVADNGPGFPPEVLDGSRRGFGLTVAAALTEQHGGELALSNSTGAVVTVSMEID